MSSTLVFGSFSRSKSKRSMLYVLSYNLFHISLTYFLGPTIPTSSQSSRTILDPSNSRPQTPPPRHSRPPRTPDSNGLTPSSCRASARRRINSPPSPRSPSPVIRLNRPRRIIRPRRFYGDTPTPSPPQPKLCSRTHHFKPLADYIDTITGKEYNVCEACRNGTESVRLRVMEIEDDIRHEEELQRTIGSHGTLVTL